MISHDFHHALLNQLVRLICGPAILLLIPLYLTPEVQGYWFLFLSIGALAVMADLGFANIILQFAAHEYAHLSFEPGGRLSGSETHLQRLGALFQYSLSRSLKASLLVFPIMFVIGIWMLYTKNVADAWILPWAIYCLGSVIAFLNSIVLAFFEGCDSVGAVHQIRYKITMTLSVFMVLGLVGNLGLYTLALSSLGASLIGAWLIYKTYRSAIQQLRTVESSGSAACKHDIFPLLWRYAISWASGYFIFQVFTPLTFHYFGASEAGKVGLSIAVWMALFNVANTWIVVVTPKLNILTATQKYEELYKLFKNNLMRAAATYGLIACIFFAVLVIYQDRVPVFERLVTPLSLFIIGLGWFLQIIVNAFSIYLRASKKEPFVFLSVANGIYIVATTWLLALSAPPDCLFLGFLSSYIWGLPLCFRMFRKHMKTEV